MASQLSEASTLRPEDSASQAGAENVDPTSSKAGPKPKRGAKNTVGKGAPTGRTQTNQPAKPKTQPSQPNNATIPLTGWAELDLVATRIEVIPTFTVDAAPYIDLVGAEFDRIVSRCPSVGKFIPFALFQYYCIQLFWYRVLFLQKSNGQILSTEEKNFLNTFVGGEEYNVPLHIAQYLASIGNFIQGNETYFFRKLNFQFTGVDLNQTVEKGWLDCGNASTTIINGTQFWAYAQVPVPAVAATTICNEVAHNSRINPPPNLEDLEHITPDPEDDEHSWIPNSNILGWLNTPHTFNHNAHGSTYANLGWMHDSIPMDAITTFLFSPSSMRWMSDKLATAKELKLYLSGQLTLSTQGAPMQAYFLASPLHLRPGDEVELRLLDNRSKASQFTELSVQSRFGTDAKALTPSFSFGYRLFRELVTTGYVNRMPIESQRSNHQPWFYVEHDSRDDTANVIQDPPGQFMLGINATWTYGSAVNLNNARFETIAMRRDNALQRALVLVD
nr:coat protein [Erysiphe necator associated partiti-like virus 1]